MSSKICLKCGKPLQMVGEGKVVADLKTGQSIHDVQGDEWTTYTCQNRNCEYYNKTLVWDKSRNTWKRLPNNLT